jgi:hypothetical protein
MRIVASARLRQSLYVLGDEGVVYSEPRNRFVGLDAAGVSAYCAFEAGASVEELTSSSTSRNLPPNDGLEAIYALSVGVFPAEDPPQEWPAFDHPRPANIEVHGIPISLEYPAGPLEDLCRDYFRNCPPTTQPARCHLCAVSAANGWAIHVNGREFLSLLRPEQLGLGFLHATRSLLYAEGNYDVAFHAAVVASGDCGIMLCAPREFGKSTLAAYLMARGFDLLTDEPALLRLDTSSVSSLNLPVSLKEGSWPVLQHAWPRLADAPIHVRSDGTRISLLHPLQERRSVPSRHLSCILFPHYNSSSAANAEPLLPLRTLRLLNEGGMLLAKHLTRDTFEAFLRFVCRTPAFIIQYASLEDAYALTLNLLQSRAKTPSWPT